MCASIQKALSSLSWTRSHLHGHNPGKVIIRSERTRTWNSSRKAMFRQNLGVRDPPNLPLCRACHAATPSIVHSPAALTPTSLFGACKYTLGGCMCASSPFLYLLPRFGHRTVIPHLSAPWPPLISSFSQNPVVEWPKSLQTLHFLDPLRKPLATNQLATNQLLWIPLLFNVSSHGTWMGSVRVLDLATLHSVRSNTRILSRCSASNCLASRTFPACLIFRHSRDPRKCCLPAFRAYLVTVPLLLVLAAWFPFVAHMVIRP